MPAELVVVRRDGAFFSELDPRIRVFELPQQRTLTSIFGLKRYIEARRPFALISSLTHTNIAAIIARSLASFRTKLLVVERNQFTRNRKLKTGLVRLSYGLVPMLYRRADLIGAVSTGVRDDLAQATGLDANRVAVLYNPVVSDELDRRADAPLDHPWFAEGAPPVILAVGRFSAQKNFPLLMKAFASVRSRRPVRLLILGEGALRDELEALTRSLQITEDVALPGFDANPFRYMRRAGVFVLSSDWEGLPTVLIEAMACGAPVVATDCDSGPGEILLDGKLGRIVPRGETEALAQAIEETLDAPGDRAARIARAKEFSLENAVDHYLSTLGWT